MKSFVEACYSAHGDRGDVKVFSIFGLPTIQMTHNTETGHISDPSGKHCLQAPQTGEELSVSVSSLPFVSA